MAKRLIDRLEECIGVTREGIVHLSLQLVELRRRREDIEREIHTVEAELDASLGGQPADYGNDAGRESDFTRRVLYLISARPETTVRAMAVQDGVDGKRIHNALRTLERQGRVVKVGRGRWQAVVTCDKCLAKRSVHEGPCPTCGSHRQVRSTSL